MGFREQALHYCRTIEVLTGVNCILLNATEKEFYAPNDRENEREDIAAYEKDGKHLLGSEEAWKWSGHYQYQGADGWSYLVISLRQSKMRYEYSMILGPFAETQEQIHKRQEQGKQVPFLSRERLKALQETVSAICGYLSGGQVMSALDTSIQSETLQVMYLNYPQEEKKRYPLDDERQLQHYIRTGNKEKARQLLNSLLLELYTAVGTDLLRLKMRIRELLTLMSRAAAEGGADVNQIFTLCDNCVMQMDMIQDFDELDACLSVMLHKFFDLVFDMNGSRHLSIVQQIASYIQEHLAEKLTLEQVAGEAHISKSYLCRILKEEMGCTFTEYANRLRIERSKLYLHRSNMPLSEIAYAVGFDDQSYFTKIFKREVGMPPGKYRSSNVD